MNVLLLEANISDVPTMFSYLKASWFLAVHKGRKVISCIRNHVWAWPEMTSPIVCAHEIVFFSWSHGHAVFAPPLSILSAHTEPVSQGHCWKWHAIALTHMAESFMTGFSDIGSWRCDMSRHDLALVQESCRGSYWVPLYGSTIILCVICVILQLL